ncbi:acyl carrier protein [Streptomyces capparidis]
MIEHSVVQRVIQDWLVERFAARLGMPAAELTGDTYIDELDIDSVDAVRVVTDLERWFGQQLDVGVVRRHPTIEALSGYLAREYARRGTRPLQRNTPAP